MRKVFPALVLAMFIDTCLALEAHSFDTQLNAIANYHKGSESWLNHGLGRFQYGDQPEGGALAGEANLGYRYQLSPTLRLRAFAQAQLNVPSNSTQNLGLVEFEARYRKQLDFNNQLTVKAGQFFLPTSFENVERFWESPYTINYSSLNSWIGEEFRPIGLDAQYRYETNHGDTYSLGLTAFGGNDSMGALIAYRGWSHGRLRTAYGDVLSLPRTLALSDGGMFGAQRDDGTKPFGRDLDGRPGYALRFKYVSDRLALSALWVDNMGDAELHHGEYAWRTRFLLIGGSWFISPQLEWIVEATNGDTEMGAAPGVAVDFYSAYSMFSYRFDRYRLSYRFDAFGANDVDVMDDDNNDFGRSHTLALMFSPTEERYRLGTEIAYLTTDRPRTMENGQIVNDSYALAMSVLLSVYF